MTGNDEMVRFLQEGLTRYAEAREAVDLFEREIKERLVRRLEEKQDWQHFTPQRGERGRGKALDSGMWSADDGRRLWATQASALESDGWLQLELWWRSPRDPDAVLACLTRYDDGYRVTRGCRLEDPKAPVVCGRIEGKKQRLYAVVQSAGAELDEVLRLLLDEMDRALGLDPPSSSKEGR